MFVKTYIWFHSLSFIGEFNHPPSRQIIIFVIWLLGKCIDHAFLLFEHQYIKRCDMHKVLGSCLADITCEPISMHQIQLSRFVVN